MTPKTVIHLGHNAGKSYFYHKFMSEGTMTTKTETLYRLSNTHLDEIKSTCYDLAIEPPEPVQVHVGEFWIEDNLKFKKVTHVLSTQATLKIVESPNDKGVFTVKAETSDDYEWILLKEGDQIREGDAYYKDGKWNLVSFKNSLAIKIHKHCYPHRRRVSTNSQTCQCDTKEWDLMWEDRDELQKKVEELEEKAKTQNIIWNNAKHTIESQKREIEELNSFGLRHANKLQGEIDRLKSELEEAKNSGVVWEKSDFTPAYPVESFIGAEHVDVYWSGLKCRVPLPPQPRTVEDEAQVAWEKTGHWGSVCENFKKGFKARAAKEGAGE